MDAPIAPLAGALGTFSSASIGRFRRDLLPAQLQEIEEEAGALLASLGYLQ